ncbi:MAG: GntR family transcriptional regulator [Syntrophomonadaceae bacterium]|jgi:GntR family transcriptional regulator
MFELDLRSRIPVYEQLVEKIIELIINDVLKADQQLPSVRVLSGQLTINPNTIQKAYRELEHRGYIYSLPGKGSFVKPAASGDYSDRLPGLKTQLARIVSEMLYLGMPPDEIVATTKNLLSTAKGGKMND